MDSFSLELIFEADISHRIWYEYIRILSYLNDGKCNSIKGEC